MWCRGVHSKMKLIIAGSRTLYPTLELIDSIVMDCSIGLKEVISGGARGIDKAGEEYVEWIKEKQISYGMGEVTLRRFPANWDKHGKAAGPIRNKQMAEYGDALLLIWDGTSRGSKNMKETMLELGKPVYEVILRSYNVPEEA